MPAICFGDAFVKVVVEASDQRISEEDVRAVRSGPELDALLNQGSVEKAMLARLFSMTETTELNPPGEITMTYDANFSPGVAVH